MRRALWVALIVACVGAAVGVYLTSDRPDGLERVTQDLGLGRSAASGAAPAAPAPPRSRARRSALALLGALAVAGVALGAGRLLSRAGRRRDRDRHAP